MEAPRLSTTRIVVSRKDFSRLESVIGGAVGREVEAAEHLESELSRAQVVPPEDVPRDVVTMRSRVRYEDGSGQAKSVTLVYPHEANPSEGRISVLAPLGAALLGLRVGDTIDWPLPGGRTRKIRVTEVEYQPEADGEYDL